MCNNSMLSRKKRQLVHVVLKISQGRHSDRRRGFTQIGGDLTLPHAVSQEHLSLFFPVDYLLVHLVQKLFTKHRDQSSIEVEKFLASQRQSTLHEPQEATLKVT